MSAETTPEAVPFMGRLEEVEVVELLPGSAWFVGFTRYRYAGAHSAAESVLALTRHLGRSIGWAAADEVLERLHVADASWYFYLDESAPAGAMPLRNGGKAPRVPFGKPYWKGHVLAVDPITIPNDEETTHG